MSHLLVMLDLDGTLIDSGRLYFEGFPEVTHRHTGRDVSHDDIIAQWGKDARSCLREFAGPDAADTLVDEMYADFEQYYIDNHHELALPYEGVENGLSRLRNTGALIGIVTTRPRNRADLVREFDWASDLAFVVSGDDAPRRKPAPDPLDFAIDRYGNGSTSFLYLGDAASDIKAAQASSSSISSVAAMWDAADPLKLAAAGPDQAFDSFNEFVEWVLAECA